VSITVDGEPLEVREGESVLAALWASGVRALHRTAGVRALHRTEGADEPRGFYCGIGLCFDCLVVVDGERSVRACVTPVVEGMAVELQQDAGWRGYAQ